MDKNGLIFTYINPDADERTVAKSVREGLDDLDVLLDYDPLTFGHELQVIALELIEYERREHASYEQRVLIGEQTNRIVELMMI